MSVGSRADGASYLYQVNRALPSPRLAQKGRGGMQRSLLACLAMDPTSDASHRPHSRKGNHARCGDVALGRSKYDTNASWILAA